VYATAAKTPLVFRQIVGRFVRTLPGRPPEPSWLYVPADPILREHASSIETELRHVLAMPAPGEEGWERPERRQSERGEATEFEPLSAEVAPQLTLFGPPPRAVAAPASGAVPAPGVGRAAGVGAAAGVGPALAPAPGGGAAPAPGGCWHDTPAFERRALLRGERHRLVAEVRRRDGASHREINAWLNRRVGVTRVEDATIEQLERSVELLVGKLTRRR
jgi:hypothetical protein